MTKLSANRAAKEAGVAIKPFRIIGIRMIDGHENDKGHWEIKPAELFRVFSQGGAIKAETTVSHPPQRGGRGISDQLLRWID